MRFANLRDLSVAQRLAIGFGAALALLILQLGIFYFQSERIQALDDRLTGVIAPRVEAATAVRTAYLQEAVAVRNYALGKDERDLQDYRQAVQESRAALLALQNLAEDANSQSALANISSLGEEYTGAADRLVTLAQQGADAAAIESVEAQMADVRLQVFDATHVYTDALAGEQKAAMAEIGDTRTSMTRSTLGLGVAMALIALSTAYFTTRSIRNPVSRLMRATQAVEEGDYTLAASLQPRTEEAAGAEERRPRDELRELARSFGSMAFTLRDREARL
ncbi:MAG: HAMP domain-containing protein, partial [Chloroflexota bacterium]